MHYLKGEPKPNRERIYKLAKRLRHRGPDSYKIDKFEHSENEQTFMVHKRLAIVAPGESGEQPLYTDGGKQTCFIANGEIYNHQKLRETFNIEHRTSRIVKSSATCTRNSARSSFRNIWTGCLPRSLKIEKQEGLSPVAITWGRFPCTWRKGKTGPFGSPRR